MSGNWLDPKNWRENGRPAARPPDAKTDVLLPAAGRFYVVRPTNKGAGKYASAVLPYKEWFKRWKSTGRRGTSFAVHSEDAVEVRHLTIEKNAACISWHVHKLIAVWGNLWVKRGGWVHWINLRGPKHCFFRMDSVPYPSGSNSYANLNSGVHPNARILGTNRTHITHKLEVCKYNNGSVEFTGNMGINDEIQVQTGKLIINDGFRYNGLTRRGTFEVFKGAVLELQSGAVVAPFQHNKLRDSYNMNVYKGGVIQAGSPDRPLTRDVHLLFSESRSAGLYSASGSSIKVYSSDPKKARLVFSSIHSWRNFCDAQGRPARQLGKRTGNTGIKLHLAGEQLFDGVMFDCVRRGGIQMINPQSRRRWKNVSYGRLNAAKPDELFASFKGDPNSSYNGSNVGRRTSGPSVLYKRSMKSMEDYLRGRR